MDDGLVPIADPAELAQVREQARGVHVRALLFAALLTTAAVLLNL